MSLDYEVQNLTDATTNLLTEVQKTKARLDQAYTEFDLTTAVENKILAEAARDAAFVNASVYSNITTGRAAVADGAQFMVAGTDEIIRYRRDTSSTQTELTRYPTISRIDDALIDPFSENRFGVVYSIRPEDYVSPTSGVTLVAGQVTVASAGRIYPRVPITLVNASIGNRLRVAFRRLSGTGQPATLRWLNASNTQVSTVTFVARGGWWVAEGDIPATTTQINIDWTNSTGSPVILTPLRASVVVSSRETIAPDRARVDGVISDTAVLADLWPGVATVGTTAGSGTATINSDGTVTIPAGANVELRPANNLIVRAVTDVVTVLVRINSPLVRSVKINPIGTVTGTSSFLARHIGDGWWLWTGALTVSGQTTIKNIYIVVDNRNPSIAVYTAADVIVQDVVIVDGGNIPARLPAPAPDTYPDDEVVMTQSAGVMQIHHRAGEVAKYIRWTMTRYDSAGTRALGWHLTNISTATRSGATAFTAGTALTDSGEFEVAIREVGKSDFMGGLAHGDMQETRDLIVIVDGQQVTPDGATSYRARRIEAIQRAQLWEVDNGTNVLSATLITRWVWERGEMRLANYLTWGRNMSLQAAYLAMLPILRAVSSVGYAHPDYAPLSISASGHNFPISVTRRLVTTGGGIKADIEVVRGAEHISGAFIEDTAIPDRNKLYFSVVPIGGNTAVVSGDVIDFEAVYRIGVSA